MTVFRQEGRVQREAEFRSVPSHRPTGSLPSGHPSGLRTRPWLTRGSIKSHYEAKILSRGV